MSRSKKGEDVLTADTNTSFEGSSWRRREEVGEGAWRRLNGSEKAVKESCCGQSCGGDSTFRPRMEFGEDFTHDGKECFNRENCRSCCS